MVRIRIIILALAAGLCVLAAWLTIRESRQAGAPGDASSAALTQIGGPFALTDQNGRLRTDRDFRGHYMLLYFGYTYCPDVCPTTLQDMADALQRLGARAAQVTPVFITVDPARDTPAVLKKYLATFGPRFVGLTGTQEQIARAAKAYRVYFAREKIAGGYAVDHSSVLYLVGPDGRFVTFYEAQQKSDAIAKDLAARL